MIESIGPASCRDGFLYRLFSHMRLQAVRSDHRNSPLFFSSLSPFARPHERSYAPSPAKLR